MEPTEAEIAGVRRAVKKLKVAPAAWGPVTTGGHTPARRWIVTLEDGRTVFAKVATDAMTASWLRDEHLTYSLLRGATFMPRYVGFHDDGVHPVLVIEDLSAATWPPPWDDDRVASVLRCVDAVATTAVPEGTPRVADDHLGLRDGWAEVEDEAAAFLSLGLCSPAWLDAHLGTLRAAGEAAPLDGDSLLHFDVRSDNVCFRADGTAVLVDWNWTSVGNPAIDAAFWLPSLEAEGGPPPEEVVPGVAPELVACWAGFLCSHAARAPIPGAPQVRRTQLRQARTALPWAARALGVPPPA
jgi:hypothetical protein